MISKWITIREEIKPNLHVSFYKTFVLDNVEDVNIDISADDYYKLYVNGEFVGQGPAPSYSFDYAYNRYDISKYLCVGENKIETVVYYQGLINRVWVSGDNKLGLAADIYSNEKLLLGTDESWKYKIINSFVENIKSGYDTSFMENRDFTLEDSIPFNAVISNNEYKFEDKAFPSLNIYSKKVKPVNGIYDFGEEYVGNLRITAIGEGNLTIRYAEELENGKLKYNLRCNCDYEEIVKLNGEVVTFETYDYKAFRYVEIIEDNCKLLDLELLVQHYPYPDNSWILHTKDNKVNLIFNLCRDTIKYGVQESYIDCPTREKGQYIGDAFISGFAHYILTSDSNLLKRTIKSVSNGIIYSGKVLAVTNCAYMQEIADYSLIYPLMLLNYYNLTGDKAFTYSMLPTCQFILDYYKGFENSEGLLESATEQWNLVDWPENLRDDYDFSSVHNVINAYYYSAINSTEKLKDIFKIPYNNKSNDLKCVYNKEFLVNGLYVDNRESKHSSIHSNMLPLAFGISDSNYIGDFLIERGMQCGTYMSYFYLKALCNLNRYDDIINTITNETEHGWLNMIAEGATRCFEAWGKEQKWNTSLFHPWSTSPILILYELYHNKYFEDDAL